MGTRFRRRLHMAHPALLRSPELRERRSPEGASSCLEIASRKQPAPALRSDTEGDQASS
jgi:hypothetical protein